MTDTEQKQQMNQKRMKSLKALTRYFQKIQFLTLSQTQFSTSDLQELSIFAQYSIHPIYKGKKIYKFYQKLADFYWNAILGQKNQRTQLTKSNTSLQQNDQRISIQSHSDYLSNSQINELSEYSGDKIQKNDKYEENIINENTEAIMQQIQLEKMVSKNYEEIKIFIKKFNTEKNIFSDNLDKKIQILQSWNVVSHKLHNYAPKKQSQSIKLSKITSKTYLQDLKTPKIINKDSFGSSTIILGKNQSTQTKQMKYMLKIQSKKNFVDQKKKQQQSLSVLNKKSIELTYFLNIITKEFFQDFSNQIQRLIEQNIQIIPIFCQKILAKAKDEHNFIQIYVKLIKKLCRKSNNSDQKIFSGILQKKFVSFFQHKFIELISQNVNYTQQSEQSFVYQKQMIGVCTFIGKLMRQNILSLKIFKVCFWQIVYRFVAKVKQNSQNYITNECLIAGIVLISDSMEEKQLRKIIQKEKVNNISEEVSQQAFQKMINALVNPNDQDSSSQGQLYDNLIDSISILEYPSIVNGLLQIFQSKRLKLKFLVEGWSQKMKNLQKVPNYQNKTNQLVEPILKNNQVFEKDNNSIVLIKQIKQLEENISIEDNNIVKLLVPLRKKIHQQNNSSQTIQSFINEFLNMFADTTKKFVMHKRIEFMFQLLNSFNKDYSKFEQIFLNLITVDLFEQLMIIQCDFPFLVEGLSRILIKIMKDLELRFDQVLQKVKYDKQDEDLQDFYKKIEKSLNLLCKSQED